MAEVHRSKPKGPAAGPSILQGQEVAGRKGFGALGEGQADGLAHGGGGHQLQARGRGGATQGRLW